MGEGGRLLDADVDMVTCRPSQARSGQRQAMQGECNIFRDLDPASRLSRNTKRMQQAPTSCPCPSSGAKVQIQVELVRVQRVAQKRCQVLSCAPAPSSRATVCSELDERCVTTPNTARVTTSDTSSPRPPQQIAPRKSRPAGGGLGKSGLEKGACKLQEGEAEREP